MENKEIYIDGVDASKCIYFQQEDDEYTCGAEECNGAIVACRACDNCYYKQLQAKEQECNKLQSIIDEAQNSGLDLKSFLVCEAVQNEYEQQLEKLKQECEELKAKCKKYGEINEQETKDYAELKAENETLKQYKASKQASYEEMQKRWNNVELENRKLKQTLADIKHIAEDQKDVLESMRIDIAEQILNKISEVLDEKV